MKTYVVIVFLIISLASCAPAATALPTAMPASVTPTDNAPTSTPTPELTLALATPLPTQPTIPILTPDAFQAAHWKEYQTELAKLVLSDSGAEYPFYKTALCEWDILGRSGQQVYVWAICGDPSSGGDRPAAIYLNADGSIRDVKVAFSTSWDSTIRRLFPTDVQAKIYMYASPSFERSIVMGKHLTYRLTHPDELPLIVLSATPTPELTAVNGGATPLPTQSVAYILTPDSPGVARWESYQTELAKVLLAGYGPDAYRSALCEWDILARSGLGVYVWANCGRTDGWNGQAPAIIHLDATGYAQSVEAPHSGPTYNSDVQKMIPVDVRTKIALYYTPAVIYTGRPEVLRLHLVARLTHQIDEPPLTVLSATPAP